MNQWYGQMFNPQYVNQNYQQQLQMQHDYEQRQEIAKAVKAIHDYFDAARKIEPEYQEMAFAACIATVLDEMQSRR